MRMSCTFVLGLSLLGFGLGGSAKADQASGRWATQAQAEIQKRFHNDPDLKNNRIQTTIDVGVVTLRGTVDTDVEKAKAAQLAMVKGITQVDNRLEVGSTGVKDAVNDASITARLRTELLAEEPLRAVLVETNHAVVALTGRVASETAHQRAIDLARTLEGVTRIEDNIKIVPPAPAP